MWKQSKDDNPKPGYPPFGKSPVKQLKERATIGPSIIIKGEIAGEEDLTIQGRVEGTIDLKQNNITIVRNGCVKADICGKVISIEGEVQGNLFGEEKIVVRGSGVVRGNMRAPRVNLEEGAKFSGNIDMEFESGEKRPTLKAVQVLSNQASSPRKETSKKGYSADPSKPNGSGVSSELVSEKPRL
jgi:cytoskeletal protein CcmA (bactofilin family)